MRHQKAVPGGNLTRARQMISGKEIVDDSILNNGSAAANPRKVESQHNRDDRRTRKQSSDFHKSPSRYPSQSTIHFFIHKHRLVRNQSDIFNDIGHQKSEPAGPQQFRPASPNLFGGWQCGLGRVLENCLDCPPLCRWKGRQHMGETTEADAVEELVWDHAAQEWPQ